MKRERGFEAVQAALLCLDVPMDNSFNDLLAQLEAIDSPRRFQPVVLPEQAAADADCQDRQPMAA